MGCAPSIVRASRDFQTDQNPGNTRLPLSPEWPSRVRKSSKADIADIRRSSSPIARVRKMSLNDIFRGRRSPSPARKIHVNTDKWQGEWSIPMSLFGDASMDCCQAVANYLDCIQLVAGEILFQEGEEGTSMFFINCGSVSVRTKSKEIAILGPGMYFGELGLMLNDGRKATIIAKEECEVLELKKEDFYQVCVQVY